jgi:hypothetical protein
MVDMLYRERNTKMRIDAPSVQPQILLPQQQTREIAGEKEPDGDWDDMTRRVSMTPKTAQAPAPQQINPQGVGTKVDIIA